MTTINVSTGKKYLTQRDNTVRPLGTCAPTSLAMLLTYSGTKLPEYKGQLEDRLTEYANSNPEVQAFYSKFDPSSFRARVPANEIHTVLAYAVNHFVGSHVVDFTFDNKPLGILKELRAGRPLVMSGVWAGLNHVICVVGFNTDQNLGTIEDGPELSVSEVKSMIIDDPYGDYRTGYKSTEGNDIEVPFDDFWLITKPRTAESKWAYRVHLEE